MLHPGDRVQIEGTISQVVHIAGQPVRAHVETTGGGLWLEAELIGALRWTLGHKARLAPPGTKGA